MDTTKLLAGLVLLSASSMLVTMAAPALDLCAGCTMVNGAGYNTHPTDCDKFVHCHLDALGRLVAQVQQCAFGTEWDMEQLTCLRATTKPSCATDKCLGQVSGTRREGVGNCRGYWECRNERSVAFCCPSGQYYNETFGCLDNDNVTECTDSCFNDVYVPDVTVTTTQKPCYKRAAPAMPAWYEEEITGWGWMLRPCAAGTEFVESVCECVQARKVPVLPPAACKAEIYLPFTYDHTDQSGKGNYIKNENVLVENGVAKFNGVNSRLIIPRFTNLESAEVVVKVKYSSKHSDLVDAHAIISNNDCGIDAGIKITEDMNEVNFTVGTTFIQDYQSTVSVPQTPMGPLQETAEKDVVYKFLNGVLSGKVDMKDEAITSTTGHLRKVHCAVHIGHAEDAMPFKGEIDELTIYLCNPDN